MRSFKLRRQVKVRQLDKLTRVTHSDDYGDFQREYSILHDNDVDTNNGCLPKINGSKVFHGQGKRKPKNAYRREASELSKKSANFNFENNDNVSLVNGSPGHGPEDRIENPDSLPKIDVRLSKSLMTSGEQLFQDIHSTSVHQFDPKRRVGFKEEKSSSGVTRLFHALPTEDQQQQHQPEVTSHDTDGEVLDVVQSDALSSLQQETPYVPIDSGISNRRQSYDDRFRERQGPSFRLRPLLDERYETLRRVLVPQEPPNEGYAELSPSFIRQYPDWADRYRLSSTARRKYRKKRKRKTKPDFGEDLSEGETPSLNGDHMSDSEDDRAVSANELGQGALNSLGNF